MSPLERNVDYLIGESNNEPSIHVGRGYLTEKGKYKQTLSVPVNAIDISDVLHEQILRFESIYAIDSNKRTIGDHEFVASCAVHVTLEYAGDNIWRHAVFTRLPAVISIAPEGNPETFAWERLIKYLSPKIKGMIALVVDSELGDIPLFNNRAKPICADFFLPKNTQLIYASSERDLSSPLNKAISVCDADAKKILNVISEKCNPDSVMNSILKTTHGAIFVSPTHS
ncbi:hypothetical protein [Burkholderia cepacia]|uniref:hypothetical protein n=1 Tax=Burkholderia cepacia TaxID=292 RepID=UPI00158AC577|nr:hypothetical protein [Burkholderia cepacia]